jgi:adenylate kinase
VWETLLTHTWIFAFYLAMPAKVEKPATVAALQDRARREKSNGMSRRYRTFLIFGAPGSGKGTQGRILGKVPRLFYYSCGDIFRAVDTRTRLGMQFLEFSSRGKLVPDEVTLELWRVRIRQSVKSHEFKPDIDFLVLDGIPRTPRQAELMQQIIDVRRVFHLTCPIREELVRRLKKRAVKDNRLDDANEEIIRRRLETYERQSKPLLEYYPPEIVVNIDATQPPIRVLRRIVSCIICEPDASCSPWE